MTNLPPTSAGLLVHETVTGGRSRWLVSFLLGLVLCLSVFFVSNVGPQLVLGAELVGVDYALVGLLQIALVPAAVWVALRPVGLGLSAVGMRADRWRADALIGFGVAVGFAILQFGLIIPATGGAERSDIVVNAAQIGESFRGVLGFVVLAWTGGVSEELFFRGHFLTTLRNAFGRSRAALVAAAVVTIGVFALLHGYQGVAGVIDSGVFGGLALTLLFLWRGGRLTACAVAHATWNSLAAAGIWLWY